MKKDEEIRLRKLYNEMSEQQLIDMLSEDEKDFQDGVYALLVEEVKRRSLEDKLDEITKIKKQRAIIKSQSEYKFVTIHSTPNSGEIAFIKSLLDSQEIPYHIKGENFGTLYGPCDGLSRMDIMVREDYSEKAKELLKDFIKPK